MRNTILLGTIILATTALSGAQAAHASNLDLNPYPVLKDQKATGAPVHPQTINVPLPGDPYFNPPSQDTLPPVSYDEPDEPVLPQYPGAKAGMKPIFDDPLPEPVTADAAPKENVDYVVKYITQAPAKTEQKPLSAAASMAPDYGMAKSDPFYEMLEPLDDSLDAHPSEAHMDSHDRIVIPEPQPMAARASSGETITWQGQGAPFSASQIDTANQSVLTLVWRATQGQSTRKILGDWSRNVGVEFIWRARNDFIVRETLSMQGNYDQAVSMLLDQYANEYTRLIGKLHVDPQTDQRTLVVSEAEDL